MNTFSSYFSTLSLLCALILLSGCPATPPADSPAGGKGAGADDQPTEATVAEEEETEAEAPKDDPEAVKKLQEAGAVLKMDQSGRVVEANCKPAQMTNELMPLLKGIPSVEKLDLENGQFENDALAVLEHLPALKTINMRQCSNIDAAGLAHLKKAPQLERLLLLYTRTDDAGLAEVAELENLIVLDLRGTKIGDDGVNSLTKLTKLVDLKIRSTNVSGASMATIAQMPKLKYLALEDAGLGDDHVGELAALKSLINFNIMRTYVSDEGLSSFSEQKFQDLRFRDTAISGAGLDHLKGSVESLKFLDLSETLIDNDGVSHIAPFTNLESLYIWNGTMDDDGIEPLSALTKMKVLDIHGCRSLSSTCVEHLLKMKELEVLNFSETMIDDDGLAQLAELENLKTVIVSQSGVTEDGIEEFKKKRPNTTVNN